MNPFANFIGTLADLERSAQGFDQYQLMRIPGMLRLLLLDRLVDQVNREFRQRIRYAVGTVIEPKRDDNGQIMPSILLFSSIGDSFDPEFLKGVPVHESYKPSPVREVDRDGLLKLHVIATQGHYFTVKELIDNLAYVQGLVHPGAPDSEHDAALLGWRQVMQLGGVGAGLREIRSVGKVVHRGLAPLRDAVLAKYAPPAA